MSWLSDPIGAIQAPLKDPVGSAEGSATSILSLGMAGPGSGGPSPFNAPAMDPASMAQVAQSQNGLLKSAGQDTSDIMSGTNTSAIANQSDNQKNEANELGGGGMPGMNDAISAKAAKNFNQSQGKLQQSANFRGAQMANNNMQTAVANSIALANAQRGVDSSVNQLTLQANAARYATVSNLMKGAGSFAGGAFGRNANTGGTPDASYGSYGSNNGMGSVDYTQSTTDFGNMENQV